MAMLALRSTRMPIRPIGGLCPLQRFQSNSRVGSFLAGLTSLTRTENNSPAFSTTLDPRLDFFFSIIPGSTPQSVLHEKLDSAWDTNKLDTLKLIFHLGGVRFGKADSPNFQLSLDWLYRLDPATLQANLNLVPFTGYWKHLLLLLQSIHEEPQVPALQATVLYYEKQARKAQRRAEKTSMSPEEYQRTKVERMSRTHQKHQEEKIAAKKLRDAAKAARAEKLKILLTNEKYKSIRATIVKLFVDELKVDLEKMKAGKSVSLVGKWAPSPGCSADKKTGISLDIARHFFPIAIPDDAITPEIRQEIDIYFQRHVLVPLRSYLKIPEVFMSSKRWNELSYERVPSVCMRNNREFFVKHDGPRFEEFLAAVKRGEKKIAAGAIFPHQIIQDVLPLLNLQEPTEEPTLVVAEEQWKRMVSDLKKVGTLSNCISVCDVSGSMTGDPMHAAIALSLLLSSVSQDPWKVICNFSANPHFYALNPQDSFVQTVHNILKLSWGYNTNFQAVFDLILNRAKHFKLTDEEMIKTIFVFSDMQFDEAAQAGTSASGPGYATTDHEIIEKKFKDAGYTMPHMIYWNLRGDTRSFPTQKDIEGVSMVSGFSSNLMKIFLSGEIEEFKTLTPFNLMMQVLDNLPVTKHLTVIE